MYMQETLHVWYLSSAALALKACNDLAMGNFRNGTNSLTSSPKLQDVPPEKGERRILDFATNHISFKKIEIGVLPGLMCGTTKDLRVFAFVLHVSTQKTCTDSQSLTLPSRKVPPKMEPVL